MREMRMIRQASNLEMKVKAKQGSAQGFTLIELAVVILIVGILATVAIVRYRNVNSQGERAVINRTLLELHSGISRYAGQTTVFPGGFDDYVSVGGNVSDNTIMTLDGLGPNAKSTPCTVAKTMITCSGTFDYYDAVVYQYNDGQITVTGTPINGAKPL